MADAREPRGAPRTWQDAFAALPSEPPPADAWTRLAAALPTDARPATTPRRRPPAWAIAAMLALVVAGGFWIRETHLAPTPRAVDVATAPSHRGVDATPSSTPSPPATARPGTRSFANRSDVVSVAPVATTAVAPTRSAGRPVDRRVARAVPTPSPARSPQGREARAAARDVAAPESAVAAATSTDARTLDALRAESARLEALAAYARDDRMANGPAAVLAANAEDRIRLIDAALAQPDLIDAQRLDLWTRRVAALRELAGVEGTSRWLAANGESLQGAIALVD